LPSYHISDDALSMVIARWRVKLYYLDPLIDLLGQNYFVCVSFAVSISYTYLTHQYLQLFVPNSMMHFPVAVV